VALGAASAVVVYLLDTHEIVWSDRVSYATSLAWSHDESKLAVGYLGGVGVWDTFTGTLLFKTQGSFYVTNVIWTADSRFLVSGNRKGLAEIWDGTTGQKLRSMAYHETPPIAEYPDIADMHIALSPNGKMVATSYLYPETGSCCDPGHTLIVWDVATGTALHVINEETDGTYPSGIFNFGWSPDSKMLAVNSSTGIPFTGIKFWDMSTGNIVAQIECGCYSYAISWSPDGTKLAALQDRSSAVIDTTTIQKLFTFESDYQDELLGWSADSSQFALHRLNDDSVTFIDSGTGIVQSQSQSLTGSSSLTPDFTRFFFLSNISVDPFQNNPYQSLVEWNTRTGSIEMVLATGLRRYFEGDMSWSPDSARIGVNQNAQVMIWDIVSNKAVVSLDSDNGSWLTAWSPDGRIFANVLDKYIDLYDTSTWATLRRIAVDKAVGSLSWSPDSRHIAVHAHANQLQWMEIPEGQIIYKKTTLDEEGIVVWSSDGNQIVFAGEGGHIEVWDAATGEHLQTIEIASTASDFVDFSFSPDLSMLVGVGGWRDYKSTRVSVWSVKSGEVLHTFSNISMRYDPRIKWAPWLPDSSGLALETDKMVGIFDPRTGQLLKVLPVLPDIFSPDGRFFAAKRNGSFLLWEIEE
jgi:WD40 repeat protein